MKKIISLSLAVILLFTMSMPLYANQPASPKEEVIYAQLKADGSIDRVDVVNSFAGGELVDYGDYTNIRNLTSAETIQQTDDLIQITTEADRFFYQGTLNNPQLPWNFALSYTLDGVEVSAKELVGKSGALEMSLKVRQNHEVKPEFFNSYMLQITLTIDPNLCKNIDAPKATFANAGKNKMVVYTVMPKEEATLHLRADVNHFEMAEIDINAMPFSMQIDLPDSGNLTSQFYPLINGVQELQNGSQQLSGGLTELSYGIFGLEDGANQLAQGMNQWQQQSAPLTGSSAQIQGALAQLAQALDASSPAFDAAIMGPELAAALQQVNYGLSALSEEYGQFHQGLEQTMGAIEPMAQGAAQLQGGIQQISWGMAPLIGGADQLTNGISELNAGISQIPSTIQDEIDKLMAPFQPSDVAAGSFVSDKNTKVSLTQFVIKIAALEIPAESEAEIVEPVEKTLWEKIVDLFVKA